MAEPSGRAAAARHAAAAGGGGAVGGGRAAGAVGHLPAADRAGQGPGGVPQAAHPQPGHRVRARRRGHPAGLPAPARLRPHPLRGRVRRAGRRPHPARRHDQRLALVDRARRRVPGAAVGVREGRARGAAGDDPRRAEGRGDRPRPPRRAARARPRRRARPCSSCCSRTSAPRWCSSRWCSACWPSPARRSAGCSASSVAARRGRGGVVLRAAEGLPDRPVHRVHEPRGRPARRRYNAQQARIAIGSGGAFGKGLFNGEQTGGHFVPEQQTDFIFTVAGRSSGSSAPP